MTREQDIRIPSEQRIHDVTSKPFFFLFPLSSSPPPPLFFWRVHPRSTLLTNFMYTIEYRQLQSQHCTPAFQLFAIYLYVLFFWLCLWQMKIPGPGIKSSLQWQSKLLQWQCWNLSLLHHKELLWCFLLRAVYSDPFAIFKFFFLLNCMTHVYILNSDPLSEV